MKALHEIERFGPECKVIDVRPLLEGLESFGYVFYKQPNPKKNFDFKSLDLKSIRIMNRLT